MLFRSMWQLDIGSLFSMGRSTADKLRSIGINTIGSFAALDLKTVQTLIGDKRGLQLWNYSRGIDDSEVEGVREAAKGYSISTTLEKDVESEDEAEKVLLALADSVSARMRLDGVQTTCIGVTVRYNNFREKPHASCIAL